MGPWLLSGLWVTFLLSATAAALLGAVRARRAAVRALCWGIAVALLVSTALAVGQALWLRHTLGFLGIPLGIDLAVGAAHGIGFVLCLRTARRGRLPGSVASWAVSAALALALTLLVAQQLELRARLFVADLRFEAGRTAWRLLDSPPDPERDAWQVYRRLQAAWSQDEAASERMRAVREDGERLAQGEELDYDEPARRERLAWLASDLEDVRAAARLAECDFGARNAPLTAVDTLDFGDGTLIALHIADALHVEAGARLASGDVQGAIDDLEALGGLSRQALASPVLIDLMVGTVLTERALELGSRVLGRAELDAQGLARVEAALPRDLTGAAERALEMEEAWALSALSVVANGDALLGGSGFSLSRVESGLYLIFLLERDVRGYRTSMDELRTLVGGDLTALRAEAALDDAVLRARYESRGMLAVLAMGQYAQRFLRVRRVDARLDLAREALAALGSDRDAALAQGTWTAMDPAWGDDPPSFALRPGP